MTRKQVSGAKKSKEEKEPFVRAHKLTSVQIALGFLALILTAGTFTASWIRFPSIARYLGIESFVAEATPSPQLEPEQGTLPESEYITDPFSPVVKKETLIRTFNANDPKVNAPSVRVTKQSETENKFEFFRKKTDEEPFQSFLYNVEVEDVSFDDLNFDGKLDVVIQHTHSVCCVGYFVLLFNSKRGGFYPNEKFNNALFLVSGYKKIPEENKIEINYHCPPRNAIAIHKIGNSMYDDSYFDSSVYYEYNNDTGNKIEVASLQEVCGE